MELEMNLPRDTYNLITYPVFSDENVVRTIGRDFNKSVANLNGLIALLNEGDPSEAETAQIHRYLTVEVNKLKVLISNICG